MRAVITIAAIAIVPATMAAQSNKVDVTGTWLFTLTTDFGSPTVTLTLTQQGDSLTGHYSSQPASETDLKGEVKGRKIAFQLKSDLQGGLVVVYTGGIETNDSMKGNVNLGSLGTGTFTAKRK